MNPFLFSSNSVLIVEDEPETLRSITMVLRMSGIKNVVQCNDCREVLSLLSKGQIGVILLDLIMPHISGEELLAKIRQEFPEIPVIVVTGIDEADTAVRCMKEGALDYVVKPVERSRLVSVVRRAIELKELQTENKLLKEGMLSGVLQNPEAFSGIVTKNRTMISVFQYVESIAQSHQPVLVTGETGVGKELIVRVIHSLSSLECPLVSINVAGIDDNVFSDTLFGHVKGAFTGAGERRQGLVEKASKGTLYLDEIGDLSLESQVKLLRLLQEREYFPLGSDIAKVADARVIVTTNRDLHRLLESGRFRKDLYYRLSTHHVHIPPLRERGDDVPLLLDHFLDEAARSLSKERPSCPEEIITLLAQYDFPGNVRELQAIVYDAVSSNNRSRLSADGFKCLALKRGKNQPADSSYTRSGTYSWQEDSGVLPTIEEATTHLMIEALRRFNNNQSMTAQVLGISRQRLARHLKGAHLNPCHD